MDVIQDEGAALTESQDTDAPEIAVILLSINQQAKTLRCLSSFCEVTSPPFRILLWDNGSTDGTTEVVREQFPGVLVHHHPVNLGVASGRNAAARLAMKTWNPQYLVFIDNDIVVTPDVLQALLRPLEANLKVAQTQAKIRFIADKQRLNDGGGNHIQFWLGRTRPIGFGEIDRGQYDEPKECISCGGAMAVRADVFQRLGGFDAKFDPFGPEDLDFSLRLKKAGHSAMYVPSALVFHDVSHTFGGGQYTEQYARHKARHWFLFMRRHASIVEQLGFLLVGAPYLVLRVLIREGKRGNLVALRGLFRGMLDLARPGAPMGK